ncbi:ATP-binding protein [Denitratisoma oestradiolicum]|uniref:DNA mismatch repair protein n=1 Tax=Denitratisoma oestradiolicum TaxID=311182 RepID=A0A6S6XVY8_9PROT|nr:ATP-binding protein [Denitratisoma oestradiolicum]TWO80360.1 hypothetical protein CBW56_09635 [Denitratisoma oestradiolicum]CAB1370159.1 conserved protein of unknown function [Denitratisoma oestradiolicum]
MAETKVYSIEVQGDFLTKQTHAKPAHALAELIWNSLDADATLVEVKEDSYSIGEQRIIVADNGTGFPHSDAPTLFRQLGGSWKHQAGETRGKRRFLHGSEGKGRFKAFSLGRVVDWEVRCKEGTEFNQFSVSMLDNSLKEIRISEPEPAKEKRTGVRCVISELHKAYEFLQLDNTVQELSEIFATYLKSYTDVQIVLPVGKLDVSVAILSSKAIPLGAVEEDGTAYPFELEIIEWKAPTDRIVYLCNEAGFPLSQTDVRLQAPGLNFSAYVKSPYISKLSRDGLLGLAEMNTVLIEVLGKVKEAVKAFYRERNAEKAQTVVEQWKDESVYPFQADPQTMVEKIEREVFDIVAVKVNNLLPEFESTPQKGKRLQLRMLRQAIEKSPEDLQLILTEVLELPEKMQKEFAKLLQETSLTAIISASKVVADRLKFIAGLDALLFDEEHKKNLKERTQLHRLLVENTWIFGEEFFLTVDDQSLTEVLRKHLAAQGLSTTVDEPVKRIDGKTGIVDLMLTRNVPSHRENELDHLVVELKRPTVNIGVEQLSQIESYAFAVAEDDRFRGIDTRWNFWVISNGMDAHAKRRAQQANMPPGMVHQSEDKRLTIWAKTWSEVLHSNRQRLRLFQQKLEYNADHDASLQFLRDTYREILQPAQADADDTPDVSVAA